IIRHNMISKGTAVVADVTLDTDEIPWMNYKKEQIRGPAYDTSRTLHKLGVSLTAYVFISPWDKSLLSPLVSEGIDLKMIPRAKTKRFHNNYPRKEDLSYREQEVEEYIPEPILPNVLPDVEGYKYVYIGTVTPDFLPETIKYLKERNGLIFLDPQGLGREIIGKKVHLRDLGMREACKYANIVILDPYEANVLTGDQDLLEAVETISTFGPSEVLIAGVHEFVAYRRWKGGSTTFQKFIYGIKGDPTGLGCRIAGAYLSRRPDDEVIKDEKDAKEKLFPAYEFAIEKGIELGIEQEVKVPKVIEREFKEYL
ncbi:MAG: hypothetical protein QMD14_04940, partial [Candidatus Aenigmarchaeota archaeon]|nr:hypothetical protein [Candidatus Aenigmarchaeota archaeon]